MIYRCQKDRCPHFTEPCELNIGEMNSLIGKSTPCPIGEDDYFDMVDETNEFFCLIVGSRDYNNYDEFSSKMDFLLKNKTNKHIVIVSGGAKGTDTMAEKYAKEHKYQLVVFEADWDKEGKKAGFIRNVRLHQYIAKYEDRGIVAFWNGISKGTAHSFELAKKYNNPIKIIKVNCS